MIETVPDVGSSPRARGKLAGQGIGFFGEGLIPACAGKTAPRIRPRRLRPAHPRVCGENLSRKSPGLSGKGSSPRVRGKLKRVKIGDVTAGLIPACAGKTLNDLEF